MNEKQAWKKFREQIEEEVLFLHRDEFEEQFKEKRQYPFLGRIDQQTIKQLLSAEEMSEIDGTEALIERVRQVI